MNDFPKEQVKHLLAPYAWHKGDLSWKLDSLQEQIRNTVNALPDAKKILLLCSRQIGKSYLGNVLSLEYLIQNRSKIARIVAPTLDQCQDIVQDNFTPICQDAPKGFIDRKKTDYRWDIINGSSLRLGGLKRAHVDSNRGGNASLVIYEECGFVSRDDFDYGVNSVLGPQLLRSNGREIFITSPSEDPDHPIHTNVYAECEELGTLFIFTVFDSPSLSTDKIVEAMRRSGCTLTNEFIAKVLNGDLDRHNVHEEADRCKAILSESFRREYLAEIIRPTTLMVVPGYDPAMQVKPFIAPIQGNWHVTIDWGGVRDLTVAILHTYEFMTDMDMVWDEMMWPANTPTSSIVADLKKWEQSFNIHSRWADVPGQIQVDLANQFEYTVNIPQKSDWKATVQNMAVRFSTNKILINPQCTFLQKSLRAGMFNKHRTDFERNTDLGHCDALAALMYAIRSQDRSNPYGKEGYNRDNIFVAPREEEMDLSKALNPKRFGKFK